MGAGLRSYAFAPGPTLCVQGPLVTFFSMRPRCLPFSRCLYVQNLFPFIKRWALGHPFWSGFFLCAGNLSPSLLPPPVTAAPLLPLPPRTALDSGGGGGGACSQPRRCPTQTLFSLSPDSGVPTVPSPHRVLLSAQNAFSLLSGFTSLILFLFFNSWFINRIFLLLTNTKEGMITIFKHSCIKKQKTPYVSDSPSK